MVLLILSDHLIHVYSYDVMCMCTQHACTIIHHFCLQAMHKEVTCVLNGFSAFLGFTIMSVPVVVVLKFERL